MSDFIINIGDLLDYGWDIGSWGFTVRMVLFSILIAIGAFILRKFLVGKFLTFFKNRGIFEEKGRRKLQSIISTIIFLGAAIGILKIMNLDYAFYEANIETNDPSGNVEFKTIYFRISTIFLPIIIFKLAQLVDIIFTRIIIGRYYDKREGSEVDQSGKVNDDKIKTSKTIQYLVYVIAAILILKGFNLDYEITTLKDGGHFTISNILEAVMTLLIAWLLIWILTNLILRPYYKKNNIDIGNQYAASQLLKYVIYVIAILFALQNNLHFNLNILLGGAAALLVGIGLGMQQTFNDLISGIILLFERTIEVGDVVEVNGLVGTVTGIGIRTSVVLVRDNTSVVVPNSKFITDNVVNWSHNEERTVRFKISIGVAYGSDTELVKRTLLQVADENPDVLQRPASFVRFVDFADSSLNFELHFWSRNFIRIEDVKSDLRFQIDAEFRKNNIEIPFPQRVIWSAGNPNATD